MAKPTLCAVLSPEVHVLKNYLLLVAKFRFFLGKHSKVLAGAEK